MKLFDFRSTCLDADDLFSNDTQPPVTGSFVVSFLSGGLIYTSSKLIYLHY